MAVKNSIFIGFPWSQGLVIPEGLVPFDSHLRVDWKVSPALAVVIRSTESDGIERNGTDFLLYMTPEQTALLRAGRLTGELIAHDSSGNQSIVGVRIIVPVVTPIGEPTP